MLSPSCPAKDVLQPLLQPLPYLVAQMPEECAATEGMQQPVRYNCGGYNWCHMLQVELRPVKESTLPQVPGQFAR
jgi:hypothetical protein